MRTHVIRIGGARGGRFPRLVAVATILAVLALLSVGMAAPAAAQQDTLPTPPPARVDTLRADSVAPRIDTLVAVPVIPARVAIGRIDTSPPISPGGAFLQSLAIPGRGQLTLGRRNAAVFYIAVEALGIGMSIKSYRDLREAKRLEADSVPVEFVTDSITGEQRPIRWEPGRFPRERVNARRTHLEDWIALLIFNHLISAADAYVAANLWDFPARVGVSAAPSPPRGSPATRRMPSVTATVSTSVSW